MTSIPAPILPLNDPEAIFRYAEAFGEAVQMLEEQYQKYPSGTTLHVTQAAHCAPTFAVDSLSLELYLKCLHMLDYQKKIKGHNCKDIFGALTTSTQDKIRLNYDAQLQANPAATHINQPNPGSAPQLEECLDLCSSVFEKVRYLYEGTNGKRMFFWPLIRLPARETVLQIKPTWRK